MHFLTIYNALALLQTSAWAVTVSPRCNADNCLRGLFGSNVRSTSANLAACSAGLPTVTVSVDGTERTTTTGTAAPPAVASVCDGQGVAQRAARFKSACSCVGISPSTVTLTQTPTPAATTSTMLAETTIQATIQTTSMSSTQSASPPLITLGQIADANNLLSMRGQAEYIGGPGQVTYTVPRSGQIISASIFDGGAGTFVGYPGVAVFQVWRPLASGQNKLIGKSRLLLMLKLRKAVPFVFDAPIAVEAGDQIGVALSGDSIAYGTAVTGENLFSVGNDNPSSDVGTERTFSVTNDVRLNVAAVLQY